MVSVRMEIGPSVSENTKVGHHPQVGVGDGPRRPPESVASELSQEKSHSLVLLITTFPLIRLKVLLLFNTGSADVLWPTVCFSIVLKPCLFK